MPDHSIKYVIINSHMVHGADGQVQYVGALQDVTDRHAAEEALANARSELAHVARVTSLGGLTASITHEVSQPLSGIITNASTCQRMLAADPPNIEGARETVRRILRDGGRASDVITRLRGLFSKKAPVVEPVDLNEDDTRSDRAVLDRTPAKWGVAAAGIFRQFAAGRGRPRAASAGYP